MSTEAKFRAAVNVIRSLPKSGTYQPSHDVMLKFYSYFKQATEGKCKGSRPGIWNPINRVKWDAWNKLGDMSSEKAMELYVTDLTKIVETMAYTNNVAAFFDAVDDDPNLPQIPKEDLELVAGDIFRRIRESSSSETSPEGSPSRVAPEMNGQCDSDDDFIDTVEHNEEIDFPMPQVNGFIPNGHVTPHQTYDKSNDINARVIEQLRRTVANLEKDMSNMREKIHLLEREKHEQNTSILRMQPSWWPIPEVSPAFVAFFVLWPIVANRIVDTIKRKRT